MHRRAARQNYERRMLCCMRGGMCGFGGLMRFVRRVYRRHRCRTCERPPRRLVAAVTGSIGRQRHSYRRWPRAHRGDCRVRDLVRASLTAGDRSDNQERFSPVEHGIGESALDVVMREVGVTGVKAHHRSPLPHSVAENRSAKGGEACFDGRDDGGDRRSVDWIDFDLAAHVCQHLEMRRQNHANHANVCTSTESTGGRSRAIALQESPPSGEA